MTPFQELSLDKACKIAVDAKNGGTWHSTFKQATIRNFYENPTQATTGAPFSALRGALHPSTGMAYSHDFKVGMKVNLISFPAATSYSLLYQSGGRIQLFFGQRADGFRRIQFSSSAISGADIFTPYMLMPNGEYDIIAEVVGTTIKLTVNGTEYSLTGTRVDATSTDLNRVINSNGNWNIAQLKLTDLTLGSILYAASVFYNDDAVYPSPLLRNFNTEPANWPAFVKAWNENIVQDDVTIKIRFKVYSLLLTGTGAVFGTRGSIVNFISIDGDNGGRVSIGSAFFTISNFINYQFIPTTDTIYNVEFKKVGVTETIFLDGVQVATKTHAEGSLMPVPYHRPIPQSIFFDGTFEIEVINTTKNEVAWKYPTYEEETRLLTNLNIDPTVPYFSGANKTGTIASANAWSLKTILDLNGLPLKSTYYCRAYLGNMDGASSASTQRLTNSSTDNTRAFFIRYASNAYSLNFYFQARTATGSINEFISYTNSIGVRALLDKWTDFVVVLDNVSRMMYLYADGVLLASKAFSASNIGYYYVSSAYPIYIGSLATSECRQDLTKIDQFQYVDRAMQIEEVRTLTN